MSEIATKAEEAIEIAKKKKAERQARRITFDDVIDKRPPVLTYNGATLGTRGEIAAIVSTEGTGKSHICEAICSTRIVTQYELEGIDTLGFATEMAEDESILFLDTERTVSDMLNGMRRILNRCAIKYEVVNNEEKQYSKIVVSQDYTTDKNTLNNVDVLAMKQLSPTKRREELEVILSTNEGKYSLVILDGITDICIDPNSIEEAQEIMADLGAMAEQYSVCFLCTIHRNAGQDAHERGRGHIGAELKRKVAGQLSVEKDKVDKAIRLINAQKVRNASDDVNGAYTWDNDLHMFISCEAPDSPKGDRPVVAILPSDYPIDFHEDILAKIGDKGSEIKSSSFKTAFAEKSRSVYGSLIKNSKKVNEFIEYFTEQNLVEQIGNTKAKIIKII